MKNLFKARHIFVISIGCLLLGFILVRQFYLQHQINKTIQPDQEKEIALQVSQLIKSNQELEQQQSKLQVQYSTFQQSSQNQKAAQKSLQDSIVQYQLILGDKPVKGPGASIYFSDRLSAIQITDLINALRNIGAEAISINNTRITPNYGWNYQTFSAPYNILAIGDSKILHGALTRHGGIMEIIGVSGNVKEENELHLPKAK